MKYKHRKGMILFKKPIKRKVGGWAEMEYDAKVERYGFDWLRVKNGMGGSGDREDWVCDVPALTISIHDYHWNGDKFGANHGSFDGAIRAETKLAVQYAEERCLEQESRTSELKRGIAAAKKSLKQFKP